MNYLILVSHAGLAEGLRTSLEMFAEDAWRKSLLSD